MLQCDICTVLVFANGNLSKQSLSSLPNGSSEDNNSNLIYRQYQPTYRISNYSCMEWFRARITIL